MVRQINPSLARLWLDPQTRAYGFPARLVLQNLTEQEQRVLDFLEAGTADNQLRDLPLMAKADSVATMNLLERIGPLLRQTTSFLPESSSVDIQRQFSEIMRLYLLEHEDPAAALRKRGSSKIFLSSLNRTGLLIAKGFGASGIGTIYTTDQKPVSNSDTLDLGYPIAELGNPRAKAARRLVGGGKVELHSRVTQTYDRTDLAILLAGDVLSPTVYAQWLSRDVAHIGIVVSESGILISHLVIPGITPCLACLELNCLESDPNWAKTATQLAMLERDLADSSIALFGASIALGLGLNLIDFGTFDDRTTLTRMDRHSNVMQLQAETKNCGCRRVE
jgi:hypothetical protein